VPAQREMVVGRSKPAYNLFSVSLLAIIIFVA